MNQRPFQEAIGAALSTLILFLPGCRTKTLLPEDPRYALESSRKTASLANTKASSEKILVILDMLEVKVEEMETLAPEGGPFFVALARAYIRILSGGLSETLRRAGEQGNLPPDLVGEVMESIGEQERSLSRLAEDAADPGKLEGTAAACRDFLAKWEERSHEK
ncbi:MAG: hypothetical protein ACYTFG_02695 [Planctomycetota bacterium]|jgi:hypothetical protein